MPEPNYETLEKRRGYIMSSFAKISILVIFSFLVACSSGTKHVGLKATGNPIVSTSGEPMATEKITYQNIVDQIITPDCQRCHNKNKQKGGLDLTNPSKFMNKIGLIVPGDAENSSFYQAIEIDSLGFSDMPPDSPLTQDQIDLVKAWIDQGADGVAAPSKTSSATSPSFEDVTTNVLDVCASCHGSAITDYKTLIKYKFVVPNNPENSYLYKLVKKNAAGRAYMPPRKPLSDEAIEMLKQWILNGAKV